MAVTKQDDQPRTAPTEEIGHTGLKVYGGRIDEEFLPQLRGSLAIKTYREMRDNDPVVGAVLFAIEMLMRQVEWRVEPASENPADVQAGEFVDQCLDDMSDTWQDTLSAIMSFLWFGFSVHEEVYKKRAGPSDDPTQASRFSDGRIGWRKLPVRSQETIDRWEFNDESGELEAVIQVAEPDFTPRTIPRQRFLLFRTTSAKANPEGRSVLRNAYRPWYFKRRIEEIEGIGIERDLAGLPCAWVPPELLKTVTSAENRALLDQIKRLVRNIRRDEKEGIVFPLAYNSEGQKIYDLSLLSTGGRRQFDTSQIVTRYDSRIAMTVLADFVLLGHEKVGSFALASSKTNLFALALGSWLDSITDAFNREAIPRLFALNTFNVVELPQLVHGDIESIDLIELGDFITKLAGAGASLFPDDGLERFLREQAGLPVADTG